MNLFAETNMVCHGSYCVIDLSNLSLTKDNQKVEKEIVFEEVVSEEFVPFTEEIEIPLLPDESYVMIDDETMDNELMDDELYVVNDNEVLEEGEEFLDEQLPVSEYFCENNLEPQLVEGEDTYICT